MKHCMTYFRTLLLTLAGASLASCYSYDDEQQPESSESMSTVAINIYVPKGTTGTRAGNEYGSGFDQDKVAASEAENAMHSVRIWAFDHNDVTGPAIAYKDTTFAATDEDDNPVYITAHTVYMPIRKNYIRNKAKLDFWVVANTESVGITDLPADESTTRAVLKAKTFGGNYFGLNARQSSVPGSGLPMSAIYMGIDGNGFELSTDGDNIVEDKPQITLTRAISRLRFVFSRNNYSENVKIHRIEVLGESLPLNQYLFPANQSDYNQEENYTVGKLTISNSYNTTYPLFAYPTGGVDGVIVIPVCDDPESLKQGADPNDTDASKYNKRIDDAITDGKACQLTNPYTYLRESFYGLSGKIYYSVDGKEGEADFVTKAPADFSRNHSWIVYGYFKQNKLQLTVTVMPWILKTTEIDYQNTATLDGTPAWVENTYSALSDKEVRILNDETKPLQLKFKLTAPRNYTWVASFTSDTGNPTAFKFLNENNEKVDSYSGTITGAEATIRIVADDYSATENSSAYLNIVIPNVEGHSLIVPEISGFKIIQTVTL